MSLLDELRYEPVTRRVRASLGGQPVLDTTDAALVWEPRRVVPMYAVPPADLAATLVPRPGAEVPERLPRCSARSTSSGTTAPGSPTTWSSATTPSRPRASPPTTPTSAAGSSSSGPRSTGWRRRCPVVGHPHDPFKRIDLLPSDRHVVVASAASCSPTPAGAIALYETHIPVRWYVPHDDVVTDLFVGSTSTTTCAYKGHAIYVSLAPGRRARASAPRAHDIAWTYPHPLHEVAAIKGMFCFYSERTDLELDGVAVPRPVTPWSSPRDQERS